MWRKIIKISIIYKEKLFLGIFFVLFSINFLVWGSVFTNLKKPDIKIYFFNVGQGDSHLIESKDGMQILIDGGPPNKILSNLSKVLDFNDRHIDAIILSHPHADHISGLIEVLKNYKVDYIFESGVNYSTSEVEEFRKIVSEKENAGKLQKVIVNKPLNLSFFKGAKLRLIYPDKSFKGKILSHVHDSMVVSEFSYKNKKILFAGDMEKKIEEYLIKKGDIGDVDILKVGHQGSKTSSSQKLLDIARPEYSIIPVGKNNYGHPNRGVLLRLASIGSQIFRTDRDGTIKFEIDHFGNLKLPK